MMEPTDVGVEGASTSELVNLMQEMMVIQKVKTIDSLPNEMLRAILVKLDVQPLICIRGVSKQWKITIETICQTKTSIVLNETSWPFSLTDLLHQLNHWNDVTKNCVVLSVNRTTGTFNIPIPNGLCALLPKLFPAVQHLMIIEKLDLATQTTENLITLLKHWSSSIVTLHLHEDYTVPESHLVALSDQMDNLIALKRLSIRNASCLKSATLGRLEHCYIKGQVPQLGEHCTSLYVDPSLNLNRLRQHLNINSVTHFGLISYDEELSFVCDNFVALKMLNVRVGCRRLFNAEMITQLAQLSHLSQLSIGLFKIDLPILVQSSSSLANLPKLDKIQSLILSRFALSSNGNQFDGDYDQLIRVLANIFPNVTQLAFEFQGPLALADGDAIAPHLHHFAHLRKHSFIECEDHIGIGE